ncbi:type VI secretion system protein ImpF [Granulicella aggregans]|uniref:Type VI secretion system protein ImpF n=1 Tax=Granulicella aggregans TaxID=474949 RepID=A0A7W8E671_9BACT|nr:type VI secretion system baseplate subunit TssE [Granulicella aggregans]MBB5060377.1 type VI secretion system protein ImpF [Granulicella aggregans]
MVRSREVLYGQSFMDRLSERYEQPANQVASLRMIKESLRRDLEAALNTRRHMGTALDGYEHASSSVLNYGMEDLTNIRTSPDGYLLQMQRAIQNCLAEYEPRLTSVTVTVSDLAETSSREVRLQIAAHMQLIPGTETIFFNTVFDVASETYSVGQ